jgi:outer membrane protein
MKCPLLVVLAGLAMLAHSARADTPPAIDVESAIAIASSHHPITDEDASAIRAATARVDVERAKYWPDLRVFVQLDRTTANVVEGALFPVANLPVVSGSPTHTFDSGHTGTAAGATITWDVLGYRRWDAAIEEARQSVRAARADADARKLDVAYLAADRLIGVVSREQAVKAARASVDRAQVFVTIVKAVVDQNLRPGADLSRAEAELAIARTNLVRAESAQRVSVAQLAEALGDSNAITITVVPGKLLVLPTRPEIRGTTDPRIAAADARIAVSKARRDAVETALLPHVDLVGALWGRGNELNADATANGFVPNVPNWAVGVAVSWPVFVGRTVEPQVRVESANVARAEAAAREIAQRVRSQHEQATAILDGAYLAAETTPIALQAARDAEAQAAARYRAKLATADDVAQAQRLLQQAEIDDAVARLDVWRAILLAAYASGDLGPFLDLYRKAGP